MKYFLPKILSYNDKLLLWVTIAISLVAYFYFSLHGQENLAYYDAVARLNTARKMIDSITPGVGQLGGIWLPFPQIVMIPFIWNDFLWHTGIAGYLIMGTIFITGAFFLQKAVYELTQKRSVSLLIWFLYVTNINILLLQTMAMSEVFFLSFFILTIYFLIRWIKYSTITDFLLTGFCVMVLTLTRYEGDFIFVGVVLAVFIECVRIYKLKNREKIEGMLLLFLTVAGFGVILWCIYSALFYKDPLFWLHSYTPPPQASLLQPNTVTEENYVIQNPSVWQSLIIYSSVSMWMNGIITSALGIVGFLLYCLRPKRIYFFLVVITSVLFVFLIYGYYKGYIPLIEFPTVFLTGDHVRPWSVFADNNVRYGIVLLPSLLFFTALTAAKNKFFFVIASILIFVQTLFTFLNPQFLQYPLYKSWRYPHIIGVPWFKQHYDGGLILVAASRHEDFMFQTGLPYKDFIYEGTRDYWYDSLHQPSTHASWVIFDSGLPDDDVTNGLTQTGINDLKKNYILVYSYKSFQVYKLHSV